MSSKWALRVGHSPLPNVKFFPTSGTGNKVIENAMTPVNEHPKATTQNDRLVCLRATRLIPMTAHKLIPPL